MQGGDLDNTVLPRLVIVFENLLGLLPTKTAEAKVAGYVKFRRWRKAVDAFEINDALARRIWDLTWRYNFEIDVLTYVGPEFAEEVEGWVERHDLPIRSVWHDKPELLARRLAYMPQVARIYGPDPKHILTYGSKGRVISPANPDLVGAF